MTEGEEVYVAETATIVGKVSIGNHSSVWPSAVIRGDGGYIKVGSRTSIQDNCTLHVDPGNVLTIGDYCTVGHNAIVHGATVEDYCLIGMNSTILNRAVVGKGSIIGSGSVVKEGMIIPPYSLVVGVPGKIIRSGDESQLELNKINAEVYADVHRRDHINGVYETYRPPMRKTTFPKSNL